jgi:MFS transporter, DHA2 family, multidrug resistance protein
VPAPRRGSRRPARELGGALGLAILGTVGTAVYRDQTADAFPAEVPAEAAATASDTLSGAVQVADRLPPLEAEVLEPAREAFTQGLQVAATVSGVLVVAAAVMVARLLRRGDELHEAGEETAPSVALATQQPGA